MPKAWGGARMRNIPADEAVQIGFAIVTGNSDMVEDNVYDDIRTGESGPRYEELSKHIGTLVTEDGKITRAGWDQLTEDSMQVERNVLAWLDKTFEAASDEGHSDNDLVGSLFVDPSNKAQMDEIQSGEPYDDGYRRVVNFDYEPDFDKGVSEFGLAAGISYVAVEYFQLDKLNLED